MVSPAGADLIQHLDASDVNSIVVDANNVVLEWLDLSGNDNNAVANVGSVLYPSTPLAGGDVGLDFGLEHNDLQLLDVNETSALLDFSGTAAGNSGFTVFVACRVDDIGEKQDVIGTKHTLDNFAIRIKEDGEMQARLDTQINTYGELPAVAGDTIVFGFSYEAATGNYWFWESKNDVVRIGTGQASNGDWDNDNTLRLGNARTTKKIDDFFMGAVAEVMIFNEYMDSVDSDQYKTDLMNKWVTPAPLQHLDATAVDSIVVDANNVVTEWLDLSGNENHAVANRGQVLYPSTELAGGLLGLDFGLERNDLQLFDVNGTASLLDFTGAAAGNSGFTVFVAFRVDTLGVEQYVMGNKNTLGNFSLRVDDDGTMSFKFNNNNKTNGELYPAVGDTIVMGVSYEAATGAYWFWESKNGVVTTGTQDPNFARKDDTPLVLGEAKSTKNSDVFLRGAVGEVMVFDAILSEVDFDRLKSDLHYKWAVTPEEKVHATVPSPADGAMDVSVSGTVLSWKPGLDRISEDLYFGTDMETVLDATPADPNTYMGSQVPRYALSDLEEGQTYYWRVETHSDAVYPSPVWSFTTVLPMDPNDPNAI
jgi:hypothetical protein